MQISKIQRFQCVLIETVCKTLLMNLPWPAKQTLQKNECKKCEKHFLEMELFAQCHLLQRSIFSYQYLSFERGWVSITSLVQMTQKVTEQWQSFHHPSSQQNLLPASNGHMHFGANITSFTELLSNKLGNMLPKQVSSPTRIFQITYFPW